MTYKEFCEESEIEYTLFVTINGEDSIKLSSFSEDGLLEQFQKLDKQINDKLTEQYEEQPELDIEDNNDDPNEFLIAQEAARLNSPWEDE